MTGTAPKTAEQLANDGMSDLERKLKERGVELNAQAAKPVERKQAPAIQENRDIEKNVFYQIVANPDKTVSKAQKRDEMAEKLTYNEKQSEEENKERLTQYEDFKLFVASQQTARGLEVLETTDQKSQVELAAVFNEMHASVEAYRESMAEPKALLDAITSVRESGDPRMILNLYNALGEYDEKLAEWNEKVKVAKDEYDQSNAQFEDEEEALNKLRATKGPLGIRVKSWAAAELAVRVPKQEKLGKLVDAQEAALNDILDNQKPVEDYPEYSEEKIQLRKLKEIAGPEWEKKARDLINNAKDIVNQTEQHGRTALDQLTKKRDHVDSLDQLVGGTKSVLGLCAEAEAMADDANGAIYTKLSTAPAEEDSMEKDDREKEVKAVSQFVSLIKRSMTNTEQARTLLSEQSLTLTSFRNNVADKIRETNDLIGLTNAQLSTSLALTVDAVGGALTEQQALMVEDATTVIQNENGEILEKEMERYGNSANRIAEKIKAATARVDEFNTIADTTAQKLVNGANLESDARSEAGKARARLEETLKKVDSAAVESGSKSGQFNQASQKPAPVPPVAVNDDAEETPAATRPTQKKADELFKNFG